MRHFGKHQVFTMRERPGHFSGGVEDDGWEDRGSRREGKSI